MDPGNVPIEANKTNEARVAPPGLTPRQTEVLRLVAGGLTDRVLANRLCISLRTVSKHVQAILAKLDAPSRRAAGS